MGAHHVGSNRAVRRRNSSWDSGGYMWTDKAVEDLKTLWARGLSASQIAGQLGAVSRNAVIGKAHRLGLAGRARPERQAVAAKHQHRTRHRSKAKAPPMNKREKSLADLLTAEPLPPKEVTDIARKTFAELESTDCRWPVGEPGEPGFGFCGCKASAGLPYCQDHARRAYSARIVGRPSVPTEVARAPASLTGKAVRHLFGT